MEEDGGRDEQGEEDESGKGRGEGGCEVSSGSESPKVDLGPVSYPGANDLFWTNQGRMHVLSSARGPTPLPRWAGVRHRGDGAGLEAVVRPAAAGEGDGGGGEEEEDGRREEIVRTKNVRELPGVRFLCLLMRMRGNCTSGSWAAGRPANRPRSSRPLPARTLLITPLRGFLPT